MIETARHGIRSRIRGIVPRRRGAVRPGRTIGRTKRPGARWQAIAAVLSCWLHPLAIDVTAARAAGFDVTLDSFEVAGGARLFQDEFGDGQRDAPPTREFVDVGETVVTEGPGSVLRLVPDDGAAVIAKAGLVRDELTLRRPIDLRTGSETVIAEFLATVPAGRRTAYGITQSVRNGEGDVLEGLVLAVRSLAGDLELLARLPVACQRTDVPVLVLSTPEGVPLGCEPLDPARFVSKLFLRVAVDVGSASATASYSFDNVVYSAAGSWLSPAPAVRLFGFSPLTFPGVFAESELPTQRLALASASGLTRVPGIGLIAAAGALHEIAEPRIGLVTPAGSATGETASIAGQPGTDLRTAPDRVQLASPQGDLVAQAIAGNAMRAVDPASGRPLDALAPAGSCASGAEPACLRGGGALGGDEDVYARACALVPAGLAFDPARCALELPSSTAPVLGATFAEAIGTVLAGTPGVAPSVLIALGGLLGTPAAQVLWFGAVGRPLLVPLHADPGDGGAPTLDGLLSAEQRALLGCGPFYTTECQRDGMQVRAATTASGVPASAEASALLQSFPGGGEPIAPGTRTDSGVQPGTIDDTRVAAGRTVFGTLRRLPGARLAGDADFDPARDGSTTGMEHPFSGRPFRSELAALSWNWMQVLVVLSAPRAGLTAANDEFDPADPLRAGACSFVEPRHCRLVAAWLAAVARALDDDPAGASPVRWWWEIGAQYAVMQTTGALRALAGGRLHALGPVAAPVSSGAEAGFAVLADAPALADADGDGIRDARDDCPLAADPGQLDADADGIGDDCDNCPAAANPDQTDRGGIGAGSPPDGIGDACQCGDVSGDGRVSTVDVLLVRRALLSPPTATLPHPARCDVGGSMGCTVADAIIVQRALLLPPAASIGRACSPFTP